MIEKLSEKKRINIKILGRIPSSSDWVTQDPCWSRNTGMGPDRGHVRQPWSCRWGIKSVTKDQRFLISSWSSLPDVLDWPRAVCLLFSPSKRAKNLSGPHYILYKSREVDQTKNTGAEQLPAVRAFLIVFWFLTSIKWVDSVQNVPEPLTFKISTRIVNKSRLIRLSFHLLSSQSLPEVMITIRFIPKDPWEKRGIHHPSAG